MSNPFPWYQPPPQVFACQEPRGIVKFVDPDYKPLSIIEDFDRWFRVTLKCIEFEQEYYKNQRTQGAER